VKLGAVLVSIAALAPAALWFTTWNMSSLQWTEGVGMGVGILLLSKVRFPRIPDISYSIYVYHVPLFLLLRTTAGIYFASLFAFCLLSWYLIERPALKLKNWKPRAALCGPELVNASA
jgi:peptidoglycan/LPS O-acetylase OafA/YrhL